MKKLVKRWIAGVSAAVLLVSAVGSDAFTRSLKRTIYADSVDESGKWGSQDDFGNLEQDTRDSDGNKIYNTNYGLHTDKTVSKAYADGRTFDVDLESWYIGENPADVGMILDASGSMAWTTTNPEPIWVDYEKAELPQNIFLTDEQLENILTTTNTDNSKISYTDYQYYIYEARPTVSEFVPLGYWDGSLITNTFDPIQELKETWKDKNLVAFYPFAKRFKEDGSNGNSRANQIDVNNKDQYLKVVEKSTSDNIITSTQLLVDGNEPGLKTSDGNPLKEEIYGGNKTNAGFELGKVNTTNKGNGETYKNEYGGVMLSKDLSKYLTDDFTLAFAIKPKKEGNVSFDNTLMYIGPVDVENSSLPYYKLTTNRDSSKEKLHIFDNTEKSDQDLHYNFTGTTEYTFVTLVFDSDGSGNTKLKAYYNDGSTTSNKNITSLQGDNNVIIFDQDVQETFYLDDIYLFDTALNDADVKKLYENAKEQTVQITKETIKDRAIDDKGNVLAQLPESLQVATNPLKGWYYVNSAQGWEELDNPDIGTGKQFQGVQLDCTDTKGPDGTYYTAKNFATVPLTADPETINLIKSGNGSEITFEAKKGCAAPVQFFIDNAGYLRCFFNSGGDSAQEDIEKFNKIKENPVDEDGRLKPYTTDVRTQCSLVYKKQDGDDIKTQTLNKVLNYFIGGVQDSSKKSRISAMRFSNYNMVLNKDKDGIRAEYEENLKKLLLLDWTSAEDTNSNYTKDLTDFTNGRKPLGFEDNTMFHKTVDDSELYNYFLTGGTNTWVGLKAFADNLAMSAKDEENNKYLILFTDGRDTLESNNKEADYVTGIIDKVKPSGSSITNSKQLASEWANELKNQGYKIFCVMMASGSISEKMPATTVGEKTEYQKAVEFLQTIASEDPGSTGDEHKYYVYTADSEANLKSAFTSILNEIKKPLTNYTVQDYIDPRFDLVDKEKGVLKLGAGGEITDSNGKTYATVNATTGFDYTPKALSYGGGKDGKAKIYYDTEKDMYYLRWEVDSIGGANSPFNTEDEGTDKKYLNESQADDPKTTDNEEQAGRWFSTITVKAKDDFIGGNAILTNGNEAGMNLVFASKELYKDGKALTGKDLRDKLSSLSGTDRSQDRDVHGTETTVGSPAKGFPRVCVNVRLLPIETKPLHEVIYLGEVVSPTYMLSELENGYMEGSYYLEYLKRYAYRLYPSGTDTPLLKLLNAWLGIEDTTKSEKTFTIPYIYLPEPQYKDDGTLYKEDDKAIVNNNSGTSERNQKDIVGFLTYTWKRVGSTATDIMKEFVVKDTNGVAYSLELKFTPLHIKEDGITISLNSKEFIDGAGKFFTATGDEFPEAEGWTFGTRDEYLKALVSDKSGSATTDVYEWNAEYKPTAGNVQVEKGQNYGDATISEDGKSLIADTTYTKDVVNAGLALELLVKGSDLKESDIGKSRKEFTFEATRNYDDELDPLPYKTGTDANMSANADKEEYKLTFTIQDDLPTVTNDDSIYTIWAKLTKIEKDGKELENGLPIGTYTISYDGNTVVKPASATGESEVKFNNFNADNNRGNFVYSRFPESVYKVSEEAVTDTGDEKYLIWDEEKNLDFAKENIAVNSKDGNTLTFYFGTELNKITKGESVKHDPKTTNDYAKDRLGIIMLSYGSNRLAISKEVTSKDIAVIKEQAVLDNFWNFDIKLTFNDTPTETPEYSLKCFYLDTGDEVKDEDLPKNTEKTSIEKLTFSPDTTGFIYTATISIKSNTQVILEQLPNDASYKVSEVRSKQEKDGDFRDTYRYNILVEGDGVDIDENQEYGSSSGELSPASAVNFINQFPSVMLPSSGGIGVDRYILFGTMLTVASALFIAKLWYDRRKRRATHGS